MLTHATYKSAMFFSLGNFEEKAGGSQLDQLLGIARTHAAFGNGLPPGLRGRDFAAAYRRIHGQGAHLRRSPGRQHILVLAFLVVGAILNVAVFSKVIAVLWAPGDGRKNEANGACVRPGARHWALPLWPADFSFSARTDC